MAVGIETVGNRGDEAADTADMACEHLEGGRRQARRREESHDEREAREAEERHRRYLADHHARVYDWGGEAENAFERRAQRHLHRLVEEAWLEIGEAPPETIAIQIVADLFRPLRARVDIESRITDERLHCCDSGEWISDERSTLSAACLTNGCDDVLPIKHF